MKRDYYEVLGVDRNADEETLKGAYRRLAMKVHPDHNPGDREAEEKFKELAEAYEVLRDPETRSRYDRYGHEGLRGMSVGGFSSFEDIFDAFSDVFGGGSIFGDLFGGGRGRGGRRGRSLRCDIAVPFLEMAEGCEKTVMLRRQEICPACQGSGAKAGTRPESCSVCGGKGAVVQSQGFFSIQTTCPQCGGAGEIVKTPCPDCSGKGRQSITREINIRIPPGIEDGVTMRVTGEGEPGDGGGMRGDLYCTVRVESHPIFQREGSHLLLELPIPFTTASLGGEVEIPTLKGKENLKIPKGTQNGRIFQRRGMGLPSLTGGGGRGDLLVRIVVEVPTKLTKRQKELLSELAEIEAKNVTPKRKRF
ncbi:MAG: molecular chaperone DnaJ, partial [Planctomycetota bacterium]